MDTTKKSSEQVPFLERPIVRTILPIAGFAVICILFAFLTDGRLFQPKNLSLLLSQSYMLLISSIGVFMVMTMGGLDFSQGSMLGVASIVVCWLSHYNMVLAAIGGIVTGGLIGLVNGYFNVKRKITSFIVTICSMYLFRGVCAYATTNSPVYAVSDISKYNTLPFRSFIKSLNRPEAQISGVVPVFLFHSGYIIFITSKEVANCIPKSAFIKIILGFLPFRRG